MRVQAIQNDDADQQTSGSTSRDMGNAGCVLTVNCADANTHRGFEVELYTVRGGGGGRRWRAAATVVSRRRVYASMCVRAPAEPARLL